MLAPQNSNETVDEFIKHMQLSPDDLFSLQQNDPGNSRITHLMSEEICYGELKHVQFMYCIVPCSGSSLS